MMLLLSGTGTPCQHYDHHLTNGLMLLQGSNCFYSYGQSPDREVCVQGIASSEFPVTWHGLTSNTRVPEMFEPGFFPQILRMCKISWTSPLLVKVWAVAEPEVAVLNLVGVA